MNDLEAYLRSDYLVELFDLDRVSATAQAAKKLLLNSRQNGRWPYEIAEDHAPPPGDSPSTTAMSLFALAAALGQLRDSLLCPLPVRLASKANLKKQITKDLEGLHGQIASHKKSWSRTEPPQHFEICYSGTYGPDDPFTILWLLETLEACRAESSALNSWFDEICDFAKAQLTKVFRAENPERTLQANGAMDHMFPKLRWLQIYENLLLKNKAPKIDTKRLIGEFDNRLHLHLSYFSISDAGYDAAELTFAMEAILLLDSTKLSSATLDRCWYVLSESQNRTPYWRPLRPFLSNRQGMTLLPLSVEIANSLIRSCCLLKRIDPSPSHLQHGAELLKKYAQWLFARTVRIHLKGEMVSGWHSEYVEDPHKIHIWETSQVLLFLVQYREIIELRRAERSLDLSKLDVSKSSIKQDEWAELIHDEKSDDVLSAYSVYQSIDELFVQCRRPSASKSAGERGYSFLLFGPQGTGKTYLAKALAARLQRKLVEITPSDFIVGGAEAVEAHAKAIFDVLTVQNEDLIIFFDEIDRLILDRSTVGYERQADILQLMTPSMLTKLQRLRERKRPIFIIATNYGERIDPAIRRVGRIDEQYLVLPPNYAGRLRIAELAATDRGMTLDKDQLNAIAAQTALGVRTEIVTLVNRTINDAKSLSGAFCSAFESRVKDWVPTIRLRDYKVRLAGKTVGFKRPYEEFFMLAYLAHEKNADSGSVSSLFKDLEITRDQLQEFVREPLAFESLSKLL